MRKIARLSFGAAFLAIFMAGLPIHLSAQKSRPSSSPRSAPASRPSTSSAPKPTFSGGGTPRPSSSPSSASAPKPTSQPSFSGSGTTSPNAKSFSGSSSSTATAPAPKPNFDSAAGKAQSQARSEVKYADYQKAQGVTPKPFDPGLAANREQRTRYVYVNRSPNNYYIPSSRVIIYHDPYDNQFLQYASTIWLFNHWDSIDRSRFDEQRLHNLEQQVQTMKAQGLKADPNYVEPGVDPDLMYNKDSGVYGSGGTSSAAIIILLVSIAAAGLVIWFIFIRRV